METRKTLLIEFAKALDKASAMARAISELPEMKVELKLDETCFYRTVYNSNQGNKEAKIEAFDDRMYKEAADLLQLAADDYYDAREEIEEQIKINQASILTLKNLDKDYVDILLRLANMFRALTETR